MAVVIRLQGLPVVAGSADIRHFFSGLNIPDGGVHIIGGEKAEAFIIFATDEDARQGMSYSGRYIKGSRVELFLSSKTEMQNIIEINRKRLDRGGRETVTGYRRSGSNNSGASGEGNLSHLVAAIKKGMDKPSYDSTDASQDKFHYGGSRNREISQEVYNQPMRESFKSNNVYLYIRGMPYSSTEEDVLNFFSGLKIDEVIILKIKGLNSGNGLVKFATSSDALKGLQRNREYMGSRFIEVRPSHEGAWIRNGGTVEKHISSPLSTEQFAHNTESSSHREYPKKNPILSPERHSHSKSPARRVKTYSHSRSPSKQVMTHTSSRSWSPSGEILTHTHSRSPSRRITARTYSRSPPRRITARTYSRSPPRRVSSRSRSPPRRITARSRSRSPPKMIIVQTHSRSSPKRIITRSCSPFSGSTHSVSSSHGREYYVHVQNLPAAISKDELRVFLGEFTITDDQIIFLKPHSHKSRDAVVIFKSQRLYESVLKNHKQLLYNQKVNLFPIPKAKVPQLIGYSDTAKSPERHSKRRGNDEESHSVSYTCIYVRNFPFDVTHVEVQKFFAGFNIDDRDIHLLYDDKGAGLGEALVNFRSEDKAQKAASLNRRRFLGTEVLLRCISEEQMREFGTNATPEVNKKSHHSYEKGEHFYTVDSQGQSMRGNLKYSSYYKHSSDSVSSSDYFRDPPTDFGGRIPGTFSDGRFRVDSNFRGGSDHITLIQLKNMPLRVSHNEILDFFHGYSILPESLCIQKNKDGTSSEAVIALKNYDEAVSAINELNNRPIDQRKIKLTFA